MTIEDRALALAADLLAENNRYFGEPPTASEKQEWADRIVALVREDVRSAIVASALIAARGGDGVDRLETAIARGGNAAIAEAILAQEGTDAAVEKLLQQAVADALERELGRLRAVEQAAQAMAALEDWDEPAISEALKVLRLLVGDTRAAKPEGVMNVRAMET